MTASGMSTADTQQSTHSSPHTLHYTWPSATYFTPMLLEIPLDNFFKLMTENSFVKDSNYSHIPYLINCKSPNDLWHNTYTTHWYSPTLTYTHWWSLALVYTCLWSPVVTCTHLYSPVIAYTHLHLQHNTYITHQWPLTLTCTRLHLPGVTSSCCTRLQLYWYLLTLACGHICSYTLAGGCLQSHMFMHTLVHTRLQSPVVTCSCDLPENSYKHDTVPHNKTSLYSLMCHSITIKCWCDLITCNG
jgi:hypothetical protein